MLFRSADSGRNPGAEDGEKHETAGRFGNVFFMGYRAHSAELLSPVRAAEQTDRRGSIRKMEWFLQNVSMTFCDIRVAFCR